MADEYIDIASHHAWLELLAWTDYNYTIRLDSMVRVDEVGLYILGTVR